MLTDEIKRFRLALGETQESLARRMNLTVRTIARYERDQAPQGKALKRFIDLAVETGHSEAAEVFRRALWAEFGIPEWRARVPLREEHAGYHAALEAALLEWPKDGPRPEDAPDAFAQTFWQRLPKVREALAHTEAAVESMQQRPLMLVSLPPEKSLPAPVAAAIAAEQNPEYEDAGCGKCPFGTRPS